MSDDVSQRLRLLELGNQRNADRIVAHEEICAERYSAINSNVRRIFSVLLWIGGGLITGMTGILVRLVFFPG